MRIIKLISLPNGCFHFGKYAPDNDTSLADSDITFRSDSLFAALISTYCHLFDDVEDFINAFNDGTIKVSSLNYFLDIGNIEILFLPKPITLNNIPNATNPKLIKKIKFISKYLLESINSPQDLLSDEVIIFQQIFALHRSELPSLDFDKVKNIKVFNDVLHQKVYASKKTQGDDLYQVNVIELENNTIDDIKIASGFYFHFEVDDSKKSKWENRFFNTIELMIDNGIGGEKSYCGHFKDFLVKDIQYSNDDNSNYFINLSLFIPMDSDDLKTVKYGSIEIRGGRTLGSAEKSRNEDGRARLKLIRAINEGSVFEGKPIGQTVDISPDKHNGIPNLRYGMFFGVPISHKLIVNK